MNNLTCFLCYESILGYKNLLHHVKKNHSILEFNTLVCSQNGCPRMFNDLRCLYRHIRQNHITHNDCDDEPLRNVGDIHSIKVYNYDPPDLNNSEVSSEHVNNFEDSVLKFTLKLYNEPSLTRTQINNIINLTTEMLDSRLDPEDWKHLETMKSEYRRKKVLKAHDLVQEPEEIVLHYVDKLIKKNDGYISKRSPVTAQYFPLHSTFTTVFKLPSKLADALSYLQSSNGGLDDLKDCELYKSMPCGSIPYVIYYDDIETGNPLGSHKGINKVGSVYVSLRCFPPHSYSNLKNIHQCILFPPNNSANLDNVLKKLASEISSLSKDGLNICGQTVHFACCGFIGDNLALHQMLGFVTCFSGNYSCRFCLAHKPDTRKMTKEDEELLRNRDNYAQQVVESDPSESGIKKDSALNSIPNFHVTENYFVDLMHDVLEGVANFGMCALIEQLILRKVFSLDHLNKLVKVFPFGYSSNRPPSIKIHHLRKGGLSMSAAEVLNLVMYFGLVVGFQVPENDDLWMYYLCLRELVRLLLQKSLSHSMISAISEMISEHHELYLSTFNKHLRPKHHHMLHYGRIMIQTGPLSHNWSMRFESKHLASKIYSQISHSTINRCKTLAQRHLFTNAHDSKFIHEQPNSDLTEVGPCLKQSNSVKWINFRGKRISCGSFVRINDDLPLFYRVDEIEVIDSHPKLKTTICEIESYCEHVGAFKVLLGNEFENIQGQNLIDCEVIPSYVKRTGYFYLPHL